MCSKENGVSQIYSCPMRLCIRQEQYTIHMQSTFQSLTSITPFLLIIKVSISRDRALPWEESMSERAPVPIERVTVFMVPGCERHFHVDFTTGLHSELQGGDITPGLEGICHDIFN